jgi:hypothetical protein
MFMVHLSARFNMLGAGGYYSQTKRKGLAGVAAMLFYVTEIALKRPYFSTIIIYWDTKLSGATVTRKFTRQP